MNLRVSVCAHCLLVLFCADGFSQARTAQVDELRSAIQALEKQLQQIERQPQASHDRITRIGESSIPQRASVEEKLVIQVYDLSDLFAVAPAYPAVHVSELHAAESRLFPVASQGDAGGPSGGFGGGIGGGGGGFFDVHSSKPGNVHSAGGAGQLAAARASLGDLIEVVQRTIAPDEWSDAGGSSAIERLGNSLIISATDETHRKITDLLSLFRKRWGTLRTISARAHWLWLTQQQLDDLLVEPVARIEGKENIASQSYGTVDIAKWLKLLDEIARSGVETKSAGKAAPGGYFAALTCYNGQTAHSLSGSERTYVTNLTPVVGHASGNAGVGYQPECTVVLDGAALQVTPLTSTNAKYVVLDIHSRVNRVLEGATQVANQDSSKPSVAARDVVAALDRPIMLTHRISTTLRVPVDRVVLIGGMTAEAIPLTTAPQLYLFMKLSVQELRDDPVDDQTPTAPDAP